MGAFEDSKIQNTQPITLNGGETAGGNGPQATHALRLLDWTAGSWTMIAKWVARSGDSWEWQFFWGGEWTYTVERQHGFLYTWPICFFKRPYNNQNIFVFFWPVNLIWSTSILNVSCSLFRGRGFRNPTSGRFRLTLKTRRGFSQRIQLRRACQTGKPFTGLLILG